MVDMGDDAQIADTGQVHGRERRYRARAWNGDQRPGTLFDFMANIKSQIKRNRQNTKRHDRNKAVRSELKTRTKTAVATAQAGEDATEATRQAVKRLDKAAAKGVIHRNAAARRKSRLLKRVNAAGNSRLARGCAQMSQPGDQHFEHESVGDLGGVHPLTLEIAIGARH